MKRGDDGKLTFTWLSGILVTIIILIIGWFASNTYATQKQDHDSITVHTEQIAGVQSSVTGLTADVKDIKDRMTFMSDYLGYEKYKQSLDNNGKVQSK